MYTWILVFFTVFLKNRSINSKIKRSKVTDNAALSNKMLVGLVGDKMGNIKIPIQVTKTEFSTWREC